MTDPLALLAHSMIKNKQNCFLLRSCFKFLNVYEWCFSFYYSKCSADNFASYCIHHTHFIFTFCHLSLVICLNLRVTFFGS